MRGNIRCSSFANPLMILWWVNRRRPIQIALSDLEPETFQHAANATPCSCCCCISCQNINVIHRGEPPLLLLDDDDDDAGNKSKFSNSQHSLAACLSATACLVGSRIRCGKHSPVCLSECECAACIIACE